MENLYQEIELQVTRLLDYLLAAAGAEDCRQTGELHRQILQALDVRMELLYQNMDTEYINASQVTVHVQDEATGRIYSPSAAACIQGKQQRTCPWRGKCLRGTFRDRVFSETAAEKMSDITGLGEDHSPCKGHGLHKK